MRVPSRARIAARSGMRISRLSSSPGLRPGNTRWGAHSIAGSPSTPSPSGSVTVPSTSPKICVRAVIGTATVSSIGSCGRSADSRSSVAVICARRCARTNARGDVSARARGVSIAYISAYSPRSQASA